MRPLGTCRARAARSACGARQALNALHPLGASGAYGSLGTLQPRHPLGTGGAGGPGLSRKALGPHRSLGSLGTGNGTIGGAAGVVTAVVGPVNIHKQIPSLSCLYLKRRQSRPHARLCGRAAGCHRVGHKRRGAAFWGSPLHPACVWKGGRVAPTPDCADEPPGVTRTNKKDCPLGDSLPFLKGAVTACLRILPGKFPAPRWPGRPPGPRSGSAKARTPRR